MALWIHSLLCLIPAPIDRHAVFASANKQHDKGWVWWWKAVELYICFLMGYFQNFSFLPPTQQSNPHFELFLYVSEKHFTSDQFNSYTLHVFTSHRPSVTENGAGVSATTCCVQRRFDGVLAYVVFVCTIVEVSEGHVMLGWVTVEEIGLDGQIIVLRFRVKKD